MLVSFEVVCVNSYSNNVLPSIEHKKTWGRRSILRRVPTTRQHDLLVHRLPLIHRGTALSYDLSSSGASVCAQWTRKLTWTVR